MKGTERVSIIPAQSNLKSPTTAVPATTIASSLHQPTCEGTTATVPLSIEPGGETTAFSAGPLHVLWSSGSPAHCLSSFAGKSQRPPGVGGLLVSGVVTFAPVSRCSLSVSLSWGPSQGSQVKLQALVDSGAAVNLLDQTLARQLKIPIVRCDTPKAVEALDG